MPKTTNEIEGQFGHLGKRWLAHRGMKRERWMDFLKWFIYFYNQNKLSRSKSKKAEKTTLNLLNNICLFKTNFYVVFIAHVIVFKLFIFLAIDDHLNFFIFAVFFVKNLRGAKLFPPDTEEIAESGIVFGH